MGYDSIKSNVEKYKAKKNSYNDDLNEFDLSYQSFENLRLEHPELDDPVQDKLDQMNEYYTADREELKARSEQLEQQCLEQRKEVEAKLQVLLEAKDRLETVKQGKYGSSFADALRACERSIREYSALLQLLDEDYSFSSELVSEQEKHVASVEAQLCRLDVQQDAMNYLLTITPEQKAAVYAYTTENGDNSYKTINPFARGQIPRSAVSDETVESARQLHAFLGSQATKSRITVYRGTHSSVKMVGPQKLAICDFTDEQLVGKLLIDNGFVSTSTKESASFSGDVKLVLDLPVGTCGAYVGDISAAGNFEREFLMDCRQVFRITRLERRGNIRYIYAKSLRTKY